jgi:hypothetical protein
LSNHGDRWQFLQQGIEQYKNTLQVFIFSFLALSLAAPFAPPCLEALGLIGPRKKEKKTGFDDVS